MFTHLSTARPAHGAVSPQLAYGFAPKITTLNALKSTLLAKVSPMGRSMRQSTVQPRFIRAKAALTSLSNTVCKTLADCNKSAWVITGALRESSRATPKGQVLLVNFGQQQLGVLEPKTIQQLSALCDHEDVQLAQSNSSFGVDAGVFLFGQGVCESEIKHCFFQAFSMEQKDNFWLGFRSNIQWQEAVSDSEQFMSAKPQSIPMSFAYDLLAQQLLQKLSDNYMILTLDELHFFSLEAYQFGLISRDIVDGIRTNIVDNVMDIFTLETRDLASCSSDHDKLVSRVRERFLLDYMIKRCKEADLVAQCPPINLSQHSVNLEQPLVAHEDITNDWLSTEMLAASNLYDCQQLVHMASISSGDWATHGLDTSHMPMAVIKSGATELSIESFTQALTGSLLTPVQLGTLNKFLINCASSNPTQQSKPQVVSLADWRNQVQLSFWTKVVLSSEVKRARAMVGLFNNHFLSFSPEVRSAMLAVYARMFQNKVHQVFSSQHKPALIVSSEQFVNISKRMMFSLLGTHDDSPDRLSTNITKMINEEYGVSNLTYDSQDEGECVGH